METVNYSSLLASLYCMHRHWPDHPFLLVNTGNYVTDKRVAVCCASSHLSGGLLEQHFNISYIRVGRFMRM